MEKFGEQPSTPEEGTEDEKEKELEEKASKMMEMNKLDAIIAMARLSEKNLEEAQKVAEIIGERRKKEVGESIRESIERGKIEEE